MEFSEHFNMGVGISGEGWNFCNFLMNMGGVVAMPKQGVEHRSVNFE